MGAVATTNCLGMRINMTLFSEFFHPILKTSVQRMFRNIILSTDFVGVGAMMIMLFVMFTRIDTPTYSSHLSVWMKFSKINLH
jgi:hypothetical protein